MMRNIYMSDIFGQIESQLVLDNLIDSIEYSENEVFIRENRMIFSLSEEFRVKDEDTDITATNPNNYAMIMKNYNGLWTGYYIEIPFNFENNCIDYKNGKFSYMGSDMYTYSCKRVPRKLQDNDALLTLNLAYVFLETERSGYLYIRVRAQDTGNPNPIDVTLNSFSISLNGTIYEVTTKQKKYSQTEKPSKHSLQSNELLQTDTKIGSTSIGQYIANNILTNWKNGRQTARITVRVTDGVPIYKPGEVVRVIKCNLGDIDESNQTQINKYSLARYSNGIAKTFMLTSAEFAYSGAFKQVLQMIENVEV